MNTIRLAVISKEMDAYSIAKRFSVGVALTGFKLSSIRVERLLKLKVTHSVCNLWLSATG